MDPKLSRVGLGSFVNELNSAGIRDVSSFLEEPVLYLSNIMNLSQFEVQKLRSAVCSRLCPCPKSAFDLLNTSKSQGAYLPTNISSLDVALKGGLHLGGLTELCGPPGVGKTQICLNLCSSILSSNFKSGVITSRGVLYIDTELKFYPERLVEMTGIPNILDKLHIWKPLCTQDLIKSLGNLQNLVIKENIQLIIIDSIAALPRKENMNENDVEACLMQLACQLKEVNEQCKCCVVITNQVIGVQSNQTALFQDQVVDYSACLSGLPTVAQGYKAALGNTWYHTVSTRLYCYFNDNIRRICVVKSPLVGDYDGAYTITARGVEQIVDV